MSITTQVVLKDKELEKINYFVNMGYFEDEKALIESALDLLLNKRSSGIIAHLCFPTRSASCPKT